MRGVHFGTDGIRGPAGEHPITTEVAERLGQAVARWAGGRRVLVGRDTRLSGRELAGAVLRGVAVGGGQAVDVGVLPTPSVGVALAAGIGEAAVMVTASHNPAADNGFKVFARGGAKPSVTEMDQLEAWVAEGWEGLDEGLVVADGGAARLAWERAVVAAAPDLSSLQGRRLAIDLANGAGTAVQDFLERLIPAKITWVGVQGAPNDGVGSEHLEALQAAVRAGGLDGGFAVDGDADRCRLVNERAEVVPGDAVTWRLAQHMGCEAIAVTVMSNGALEQQLQGVEVVRTPVGDRHIALAMRDRGLRLGAEESGHILFADHPAGDGLVAGLRALVAAFQCAEALSGAFDGFSALPRSLTKVRVQARPPLTEVAALQQAVAEGESSLGLGGRVFLRYSGTEPVLRLLVEGAEAAAVTQVASQLQAVAQRVLR